MQVQETTLDWLVGLAAATALHLGPAVLLLKAQIMRVLKALFAAPSKVGHLSCLVDAVNLCTLHVPHSILHSTMLMLCSDIAVVSL